MSMGRERCHVCGDEHGVCYDCRPEFERKQRIKKEEQRAGYVKGAKMYMHGITVEDLLEIMTYWMEINEGKVAV